MLAAATPSFPCLRTYTTTTPSLLSPFSSIFVARCVTMTLYVDMTLPPALCMTLYAAFNRAMTTRRASPALILSTSRRACTLAAAWREQIP
jgi:hypothetical protein